MVDLIPERKGIYLFLLPDLKVGYVGSSNNLKRRYLEHIGVIKGGNKLIKDQVARKNKIEYMILEFCDGYANKDLKLIESNWIKLFRSKGLNLINVSEPTLEPIYDEPKAIIAYDKNTLQFVQRWESFNKAAKDLKVSCTSICSAVYKKPNKTAIRGVFTCKNLYLFLEETFSENILKEVVEQRLLSKAQRHKNKQLKVNQYDKQGNFIKTWDSIIDVEKSEIAFHSHVSSCCRGKLKTSGGFIWRYAEESE